MKTLQMTTIEGKEAAWQKCVEINQDEYGFAIMQITAKLGDLLDDGKSCADAENQAFKGTGLTGFMAGAVAHTVSQFHPRGMEFRKYWNEKFGSDNTDGTVNPAIVTIEKK